MRQRGNHTARKILGKILKYRDRGGDRGMKDIERETE